MGALTSLLVPGNDSELDFVNIFAIYGGLLFTSLMLAIYASKGIGPNGRVHVDLIILSLIFAIMGTAGVVVAHLAAGSFFKSSSTLSEASFSVWLGMLLTAGPTLLTNIRLNAFAPPSKGYALSALSGQKPPVKAIVNGVWAPSGENLALLGFAASLSLIIYQKTENIYLAAIGGTAPFAVIFAFLHGIASIGFYLFAGLVLFVMGVYLFGTDLGGYLPFAQYLPITFGLFWGVHRGINISNSGGLISWYTTILQAPEPVIFASYYLVVLDAIMAIFAAMYVADRVVIAYEYLA